VTAGWPENWEALVDGRACPMCQDRTDDNGSGVRIYAARYSDAYLQRASAQRGYTIVIWRGRHVVEPTELDPDEATGYWLEVLRVAEALQSRYRPVKMNYETLGNMVPHLHTHLVPRYADGDPAPGRPFPFLVQDERPSLSEETLQRDAEALRSLLT
jgi:diadenosine tetraphosphate (Ap4A) HIT family hydrolase